jgi:hypothetical protein
MDVERVTYSSGVSVQAWPAILQISPLSMPRPPAIPGLINGHLSAVWVALRLQDLNLQWGLLIDLFENRDVQRYHFQAEAIPVSMKRVIDDLIMGAYCIHKEAEIAVSFEIPIDGWGVLFRKEKPTAIGEEIIARFIGAYDSFPDVLNDLVNALKHSYLMAEARNQWSNDYPLICAYYAHRNDYSGPVRLHEHDMTELVLGFNKFVLQVVVKTHPLSVGGVMPRDWKPG